jgi:hypothetical protein
MYGEGEPESTRTKATEEAAAVSEHRKEGQRETKRKEEKGKEKKKKKIKER